MVEVDKNKIGDYTVIKLIGSGGTADVFDVKDNNNDHFALKLFSPDKGLDSIGIDLFKEEYNKTNHLKNDYVLTPIEFGIHNQCPFLVFPLCYDSLMNRINQRLLDTSNVKLKDDELLFTERDIATVLYHIASGLDYLHQNNIVHNDVKPDNILLLKNEENTKYVLIDFGISTKLRQTLVRSNVKGDPDRTISGMSPHYASPEQLLGKVEFKSDVFSLGVTLFEMLTGDVPSNNTAISFGQVLLFGGTVKEINEPCSNRLKELIYSMIQKNHEDRPSPKVLVHHSLFYLRNDYWQELAPPKKEKNNTNSFFENTLNNIVKPISIKSDKKVPFFKYLIGIAIIGILCILSYFGFEKYTNNKLISETELLYQNGKFGQAYKNYKLLVVKFPENINYKRNLSISSALSIYDQCRGFKNGFAAVKKSQLWSFVDTSGNLIHDFSFDQVSDFKSKHAIVVKNNLNGIINEKGQISISIDKKNCKILNENQIEVLSSKDNKIVKEIINISN